eukprot:Colp12_sorted_trinity150504_noHs@10064
MPRKPDHKLVNSFREPPRKLVRDRLVHVQDLKRGTALAVVAEGAEHALLDSEVQISVREDDRRVLRIKSKAHTEPVRAGAHTLELHSSLAGSDESKHLNTTVVHQGGKDLATGTVDHVNDARREALLEQLKGWYVAHAASAGSLQDDCVAHQESREQGCVGFVKGVVEGANAEHNTKWHTANLGNDPGVYFELRGAILDRLKSFNSVDDVCDGTINLLSSVSFSLANLPHKQLDDLGLDLLKSLKEFLYTLNAFTGAAEGPRTNTLVERVCSSIHGLQRLLGGQEGVGADLNLLSISVQNGAVNL